MKQLKNLKDNYNLIIVDFFNFENIDIDYFDRIYGYICSGSVIPRDYVQMLARIRQIKNPIIEILIAQNMLDPKT